MNNLTVDFRELNTLNGTCSSAFFWDSQAKEKRSSRLYTCIVASIVHAIFWSQLVFCSSIRQNSMQWIYAYLITDIFLLFRFFFTYIVHTIPSACEASQTWLTFVCYFDGTVDNYFNVLEVYILLALNICRFIQIKYNQSPYLIYKKTLLSAHLGIYIIPLIYMFIQFFFGWSVLDGYETEICQVTYSNIYIQVFNILFTFFLPILMNLFVIFVSIRHVHLVSGLKRSQHQASARDKYHRSLVTQFISFYTIWLSLWSPNVIVFQLSVNSDNLTATVRLLSFIETTCDPIIIGALDIRFWQAWKNVYRTSINKMLHTRTNQRRIQPSTVDRPVFTIKTVQMGTTTL